MFQKFKEIWRIKSLRNGMLFILGILIIFRIVAHIPIPGANIANLKELFARNQALGMLNILSGGAMSNFSIVTLGLGPYITAVIVMQLLTMIIPRLEEISKEGTTGYQKINQYARILTVPLAALQSYGMITVFRRSSPPIITDTSLSSIITTIITMTAGSVFLMWLGELISEKRIGDGVSLLIFAGIVGRIPLAVQRTLITFNKAYINNILVYLIIGILTITGVVLLTEGQRNIPVCYARRIRGTKMYGGMDTYLPLRVNQAGMIPIIFAISIVLLPSLIGQFLLRAKISWISNFGQQLINIFQNQLIYGIIYFLLVFVFTYFYTSIIFHPEQIAEHLQKQGGFIPGIRPGKETATYLGKVSNRITLTGALFLGAIAILPLITRAFMKGTGLAVGGASLLIVVAVVLDTIQRVQAQIAMHEYGRV